MAFDKIVAVDDTTSLMPDVVRTTYAANILSATEAEGLAVRDVIATTRISSAYNGVPTGAIMPFSGGTVPSGYVLCNGASLATTGTYATLFGVIQYAYGGSGASFNIPDLQNRVPVGKGAGIAATLNSPNGVENASLTVSQIPSHVHAGDSPYGGSHRHWISSADWDDGNWTGTDGNSQYHGLTADAGSYSENDPNKGAGRYIAYSDYGGNTHYHTYQTDTDGGSGTAPTHNNMQPYIILNYIIKI